TSPVPSALRPAVRRWGAAPAERRCGRLAADQDLAAGARAPARLHAAHRGRGHACRACRHRRPRRRGLAWPPPGPGATAGQGAGGPGAAAFPRRGEGQDQPVHGIRDARGGHRLRSRRHAPGARARHPRGRHRRGVRRRRRRPARGPRAVVQPVRSRPGQCSPPLLLRRRAGHHRRHLSAACQLMRLLLIAYEFPPSPSPQSLRWTYLARELDTLGHEVHVLTADLGGRTPGLPELPASVHVHRSFAGPLRGLLAARRRKREAARATSPEAGSNAAPLQPLRPPRNWKQRVSEAVQGAAAFIHYPDIRGEWRRWGQRALERLLDEVRPDLVISSHEPATTLELGLLVRRRGLPWVADLGDPVLAGYTPQRWRRRARRIEQAVCAEADLVTVTNPGAATLLRERHGGGARIEVITQGFDACGAHAQELADS